MPAAAVIPAPIAYPIDVAVKTPVVALFLKMESCLNGVYSAPRISQLVFPWCSLLGVMGG